MSEEKKYMRRSKGYHAAGIVLCGVSIGLLAGGLAEKTNEQVLVPYALVTANLLCLGWGFVVNRKRNGFLDILDPLVFVQITFASLFCIRALFVLTQNGIYVDVAEAKDLRAFNLALLYALLWLVLVYFGYYSRASRVIGECLPDLPPLSVGRLHMWVPMLMVIGAGAQLYKYHLLGGVDTALFDPEVNLGSIGLYPLNLLASLVSVAFYLSLAGAMQGRDRILLGYAGGTGVIALGKALLSFSKGQVLALCVGAMIIYYRGRGRVPNARLVASVGMSALFVFGFIEAWRFRGLFHSGSILTTFGEIVSPPLAEILVKGLAGLSLRREGIEALALVVRDTEWPRFLETAYHSLIMFVPRALWADKPIVSEGVLFGWDYLHERGITAYTMTIPGSGYRNLFAPGVIASALLIGIALGSMYRWIRSSKNRESAALLYAIVFPALGYFVEVGILDLISGILPLLVVALGLIMLVRRRAIPSRAVTSTSNP